MDPDRERRTIMASVPGLALDGYRYVLRAVLWIIYLLVVVGLIVWWVST